MREVAFAGISGRGEPVHRASWFATGPAPARGTLPNAILGTLIFLGAEAMFFAGLISAYLVLRAGSLAWPPPGQPRLPVALTGANTAVLLCSGFAMQRALAALRGGSVVALRRWLAAATALGAIFLAVQGTEWIRLLGYGLRVTSGPYGATFYTLIGAHGLHVLGGLLVLLTVLVQAHRSELPGRQRTAIEACRLYWLFVVGVWPVLYLLVYCI